MGSCGLDSSGSGCGIFAGCCEPCDEPSDYLKGAKFLGWVSD